MMSETKKTQPHTEVRRAGSDRAGHDKVATAAAEKATALKPRTPADRLPTDGDEVEDLFNDVPV